MVLYKRNNQNIPIYWSIEKEDDTTIIVSFGIVGKTGHIETFKAIRNIDDEIESRIKTKRKEGYKSLEDLYDNSPTEITGTIALINYLNSYLPKYNTTADGSILPMLAKTLEDNKPFEKGKKFGSQWKINGVRCIVGAKKTQGNLFDDCYLTFHSREGVEWMLPWLNDLLLPVLRGPVLDLMLEDNACLDGELYLPGYTVNDINSFVKNSMLPQHYKLQYWCYDLCIENMSASKRHEYLRRNLNHTLEFESKTTHLNNTKQFLLLPTFNVTSFTEAVEQRDKFIDLGFEGLIMRDINAEYAFGKRGVSMYKFKRKEDGKFVIIKVIPEGRRTKLCKFVCMNDINDELFECTINLPHDKQEVILKNADKYAGKLLLVEYRERSGVKQVPFHGKGITIYENEHIMEIE